MIVAYRSTLAEGETFTTIESKISRHSRVVPDHIDFRDIDCGKMSFGIAKNATTPSSIIKAAMAAIEIGELGRKQQST